MKKLLFTITFHIFATSIAMNVQPGSNTLEEAAEEENATKALAGLRKSTISQPLQIFVNRFEIPCPVCEKTFHSKLGAQTLKDNLSAHIHKKHKEFNTNDPDFQSELHTA